MSEEKLRILELFKEGKLSSAETLELLDALNEIAGSGETAQTEADPDVSGSAASSGPRVDGNNRFNISGDHNCHFLDVTLIGGGDIDICGWEGNDMIIDKPKWNRFWYKNLYKQTGDRYKIFALGGDNYEIKVPYNWDLTIYTAGGDIEISNICGQINGKTLGGDISISRFQGRLNLNTAGGDIKLQDCKADGSVHTLGGDVIFRNVTGNVTGVTLGGEMIRN
jgi:hypothetical protein